MGHRLDTIAKQLVWYNKCVNEPVLLLSLWITIAGGAGLTTATIASRSMGKYPYNGA